MTAARSGQHNFAYACFLVPGILSLAIFIANVIPMGTGTAGGVGFLILIPLALLTLTAVPVGMYHATRFLRDRILLLLVLSTVLYVVQFFVETGPAVFSNGVNLVYGLFVLGAEAQWFLVRRRRVYPRSG